MRYTVTFQSDWISNVANLVPGAHVLVVGHAQTAIVGRRLGLEIRDTFVICSPNGVRFAILFRKPISESTVAAQVLVTGTGAINIDRCRIQADLSEFFSKTGRPRSGLGHAHGYGMGDGFGGDRANPPNTGGRWPSNLLFVHGSGCQNIGVKRVQASSGVPKSTPISAVRRTGAHSDAGGHQTVGRIQPVFGYGDDDGTETVPAWQCERGCPVPMLDAQSGDRPGMPCQTQRKGMAVKGYDGGWKADPASPGYGDAGGASRFFPQFKDDQELETWFRRLVSGPEIA